MNYRVSCEWFPPKTPEAEEKVKDCWVEVCEEIKPLFCSVTSGAGFSDNTTSLKSIVSMRDHLGAEGNFFAPHFTLGDKTLDEIDRTLEMYKDQGIKRLIVIRGDKSSGGGAFTYVRDLIAYIRKTTGDWFYIMVGTYPECHPETETIDLEVQYLKEKVDAGADAAITQYFFNIESILYFRDKLATKGIEEYLYPGIMPIINIENLIRFSDRCGADLPQWMVKWLQACRRQEEFEVLACSIVVKLCQQLIDEGFPGLHFYTMNRSKEVMNIFKELRLMKP